MHLVKHAVFEVACIPQLARRSKKSFASGESQSSDCIICLSIPQVSNQSNGDGEMYDNEPRITRLVWSVELVTVTERFKSSDAKEGSNRITRKKIAAAMAMSKSQVDPHLYRQAQNSITKEGPGSLFMPIASAAS